MAGAEPHSAGDRQDGPSLASQSSAGNQLASQDKAEQSSPSPCQGPLTRQGVR